METVHAGGVTRRGLLAGLAGFALAGSKAYSLFNQYDAVIIHGISSSDRVAAGAQAHGALDLGLTTLLDINKPLEAWASLVSKKASVSVKVDCRSPLASTGDALVIGLLHHLFDVGIQPWNLDIWDKRAADIRQRNFRIDTRRGGIAVTASERTNSDPSDTSGYNMKSRFSPHDSGIKDLEPSYFSSKLQGGGRNLINLPAPRHHPLVGIDGALCSLAFGSVNNSGRFQRKGEIMKEAITGIWAEKLSRKHMLTIMDASNLVFNGGPVGLPAWVAGPQAIILGRDPVAVDAVALAMIDDYRINAKLEPCLEVGMSFLLAAQERGIGKSKPQVKHLQFKLT